MPKTGYPTPDNPAGEMDFICKSIFLPNDAAFVAVLAGQIAEACNNWYWKQEGTMSPEQAAEYMSNALALCDFDDFCGGSMSCEQVADCIETDQQVQDAIVFVNNEFGDVDPDFLSAAGTESTTIINNRFPSAERSQEIKDPPPDCDLDELWSGIKFMVDRIDERGRDFLETIVAKVDKYERAAEFLGVVPIVGELAEDLILTFIDVVPDLLDLYNSHSTEVVRQDIACDLFTLVCSSCRYPTFEEVLNYYAGGAIDGLDDWATIGIRAVVDYLVGSTTFAAAIVYNSVIVFQLWVMYAQATFLGLRGTKWLAIWADNGEEFANDEWEVLCAGGCTNPVWCYEWDFTLSDGGWEPYNTFGVAAGEYIPGVGWQHTDEISAGFEYRAVTIRKTFTASFISLTEFEIEMDYEFGHYETGTPPAVAQFIWLWRNAQTSMGGWTVQQASLPSYSGSPVIHTRQRDTPSSGNTGTVWVQAYSSNDNQTPKTLSGSVLVKRIRHKGTGTPPAYTGGQFC